MSRWCLPNVFLNASGRRDKQLLFDVFRRSWTQGLEEHHQSLNSKGCAEEENHFNVQITLGYDKLWIGIFKEESDVTLQGTLL